MSGPAAPNGDRGSARANSLRGVGPADDLCASFVDAIGVSGVVISTLGPPLGSQTVGATGAVAARVDEIQIDLGEGPCWEALKTRQPVLEPDLQRDGGDGWPGARAALRDLQIGSLFSFPMIVGDLVIGSIDLYSDTARALSVEDVADVTVLAEIAARVVLRRALDDLDTVEQGMAGGAYSRREMHQASGMVAAQLRIGVDDALLVLRGRAFSSGRSVRDVAVDVVDRRLIFQP